MGGPPRPLYPDAPNGNVSKTKVQSRERDLDVGAVKIENVFVTQRETL